MTPTEAVALVAMVRGGCPGMELVEGMPQVWHTVLADLRMVDCQQAVINLVTASSRYTAPADVRHEVRRIRDKRLEGMDVIQPPADLAPWGGYIPWLKATRKAIGDGEPAPEPPALRPRDMRAIEGVFREVPDGD